MQELPSGRDTLSGAADPADDANNPAGRYLLGALLVAATTAVLWLLRDQLTAANASLIYMLVTLIAAVWLGTWPSVVVAVVSFFCFNFFLLRPYYTLTVEDPRELLDLFIFLAAALISGRLAGYARQQEQANREKAAEQTILFDLTSSLNQLASQKGILDELRRVAVEQIGAGSLAILPGEATQPLTTGSAIYLALGSGDDVYGTVRATFPGPITDSQRRLLAACVVQAGIALQRVELAAQAQRSALLGEADALKTALLRAVSHDLRTPITVIKSSAANLNELGDRLSPAQQRELAQSIEAEADRLNQLVGDLLDMSRLQAGAVALNIDPNSLEEIAGEVAARAFQRQGPGRIELDFPDNLSLVYCDQALMIQALDNIVENSLRHEPPESAVILRGRVGTDGARLMAVNHGPSIPDEDKLRVVEPFHQAGDGRSVVGSVGLGLAIARGIVEAHHGQLLIEDTPGGGVTFVIRLPAEAIVT